jgi:oligopeptide/dipeptide ABC transporter ATP-binding protein
MKLARSTAFHRPEDVGSAKDTDLLLDVRELRTHFFTRRGIGRAVDGVSFVLRKGETLGLVGESGCGKTLTCLSIVQLNPKPASRIVGGQVLYRGEDLVSKSEKEMVSYRGRHIAMVLQDPVTALNPVLTVGHQLYEPLRRHRNLRGRALTARALELFRLLRIPASRERLKNYPHQFSGGMRQRAVGAIALSSEPAVLLADEPTTALDVTIQAAYLDLLKEIQRESGIGIVFVTHDFGVVARMCERVAVMYAGKIVESADAAAIFEAPRHPYTVALLRSVPSLSQSQHRLPAIPGQPPSIYNDAPGCPFADRCPDVHDRCRTTFPPEKVVAPGHQVYCWKYVP